MATQSTDYQLDAKAVSAYAQEAYAGVKRITGTPMITANASIDGSGDGFTGTLRFLEDFNPTINVADESSTDGTFSSISTYKANYIKAYRAFGVESPRVSRALSNHNALVYAGGNVANGRGKDLDAAFRGILDGVAATEVLLGTGQSSPNGTQTTGAHVDLGLAAVKAFYDGSAGKLVDLAQSGVSKQLSPLLAAMAIARKDYFTDEPLWLITDNATALELSRANIGSDTRPVQSGNIQFETILSGQIIVVPTGTTGRNFGSHANVTAASVKTSFLVRAGAVGFVPLPVENEIAFDSNESAGRGAGRDEMWARHSYIMHPRGYSWKGSVAGYPADSADGTSAYSNTNSTLASNWTAVGEVLNRGIVPVLHA